MKHQCEYREAIFMGQMITDDKTPNKTQQTINKISITLSYISWNTSVESSGLT